MWIEKVEISSHWHATASRQCIDVVNKTRRRLTSSIIPNTVERVVAKCTEFITHLSLWRKNCVDWINKKWLLRLRPLTDCSSISSHVNKATSVKAKNTIPKAKATGTSHMLPHDCQCQTTHNGCINIYEALKYSQPLWQWRTVAELLLNDRQS